MKFYPLLLILVGSCPGLIATFYSFRLGLAWAFVGGIIGGLCGFGRAKFSRVASLCFAMVIARCIPGTHHLLEPNYDSLDSSEKSFNDSLISWFEGSDVKNRNGWIVGVTILASFLAVAIVSIHDHFALKNDLATWLYAPTNRNGFGALLVGYLFVLGAWSGGAVGIFASGAYRRPCLTLLSLPIVASTAMLIAGSGKTMMVLLAFGSISLWIGLFLGWGYGLDD